MSAILARKPSQRRLVKTRTRIHVDANIRNVLIDVVTSNKVKTQSRFCLGDRNGAANRLYTVLVRTGEAVASSKRVFAEGRTWVGGAFLGIVWGPGNHTEGRGVEELVF